MALQLFLEAKVERARRFRRAQERLVAQMEQWEPVHKRHSAICADLAPCLLAGATLQMMLGDEQRHESRVQQIF